MLPLMARHIRQEEWDEFTERGMESIPKWMLLTGFGMMLYEGDPEALALEIAKLPAPLRPVLPGPRPAGPSGGTPGASTAPRPRRVAWTDRCGR